MWVIKRLRDGKYYNWENSCAVRDHFVSDITQAQQYTDRDCNYIHLYPDETWVLAPEEYYNLPHTD